MLLFSCVATWIWYLNLSASWKILTWPTHKDLETITAARNPKLSRKGPYLERVGTLMSRKSPLQYSESCAYSTGLLLRKKRWLPWKESYFKSLPVLGGNDYSFVPAEGAPWQTSQNPKVTSTQRNIVSTQPCPGKQAWGVIGWQDQLCLLRSTLYLHVQQ